MSDDDLFGDEHVRAYIDSNGERGYHWRGTTILLLTTTGRKSGSPRIMPLIYRDVDGKVAIVASKGGAPEHPAWYLNLTADDECEVQIKADVFSARARTTAGDERAQLWDAMVEVWPAYEEYQEKTDREIPIVVLERA